MIIRPSSVVAVVIALMLTASVVPAQEKPKAQERPNFAGMWTQVADSVPAGAEARVMTITQDAKTLTIEYVSGRTKNLVKLTYNLDGTPLKQKFMNGEIATTASWDGQKFIGSLGTPPMAAQMMLSLDGGTLVFETRDPGQTETAKRTFKKQ